MTTNTTFIKYSVLDGNSMKKIPCFTKKNEHKRMDEYQKEIELKGPKLKLNIKTLLTRTLLMDV